MKIKSQVSLCCILYQYLLVLRDKFRLSAALRPMY
jgi:hypothetical protein